ncbi:beta strand repeat-containing protein [Oleiharenicola lentus]|uniref:beta strand repeat-containing protein n=1 Tax=Oleiharenicola lentus TaxID=2508720 RepID=UPI003F66FF48
MNLLSSFDRFAVSRGCLVRCFVAAFTLAFFPRIAAAAPALSVTPSTLAVSSATPVVLHVTGLTAGEAVLVERYLDVNANGVVDAADRLVQSARITDGAVTLIGGQRNRNVPGDTDGAADGQITTQFSLSRSVEMGKVVGTFLVRVSSPTAAFSAFTETFTATQTADGQSISGTVMSDGGTPVAIPNAIVGLLGGGEESEFLYGVLANASGEFSINAPAGTYQVVSVANGFLADLGNASPVVLGAGQTPTSNVTMIAGTRTISGRLENSVDAAQRLPGVQLFVQSEMGLISLPATDAAGNFSVSVTAGEWQVETSSTSLGSLGYLSGASATAADTTSASVSNLNIPLVKANALLYGTLITNTGTPLANVLMEARESGNLYSLETVTDSLGRYSFGAVAGTWNIGVDYNSPVLAGYLPPASNNATVTTGAAVQTNFVAAAANAHLQGTVTNNGVPVPNLLLSAVRQGGIVMSLQTTSDSSGNFDFGVVGATWTIRLDEETAANNNLVGASISATVADNATTSGIAYTVKTRTGVITGQVRDGGNNPLENVNVFANATISGVAYLASARTNESGNYSFPVINGTWTVGAYGGNGVTFTNQSATVSSASTTVNFTPVVYTSHFQGTVTNNGVPVSGVQVGAFLQGGSTFVQTTTNGSGQFDLGVNVGTWSISVQPSSVVAMNLVCESLNSQVIADNQTISGLALRVLTSTGTISGTVRDYSGTLAAGVFVGGSVSIGGVSYSANAQSNGSGAYSLRVVDGAWTLFANTPSLNFASQNAVVSGSAVVNFQATVFTFQPGNQTVSNGGGTGFSVGTNPPSAATVQWEVSTDGGSVWASVPASSPYSGTTSNSLSINPATTGMNGYRYRAVVSGSFPTQTSTSALLTVNTPSVPPAFTTQPSDRTVSIGQNATFEAAANGTPTPTIQWQLSTDDGVSWNNVSNDATHSGVTSNVLTVATNNVAQTGDRYRARATNSAATVESNVATLTLSADFNLWRSTYFTPTELGNPSVSGANAIYGQDGLTNLTKYALGLNPTVNATAGLPVVTTTATEWVYTYTRPTDRADVTYSVEVSTNLSAWSTSGVTHELVSSASGTDTWRARYLLSSATNAFFRLKVVVP